MSDDIYNKYKTELDAVTKYINNSYIYNMFKNYGMTIDNKFIQLDSNINVYEACFISLIIDTYIQKNKPTTLNILEIGLAYGTSAIIILNSMLKTNISNKHHVVIDMNQTKQWNDIGTKHIQQFLSISNAENIKSKLIQENSVTAGNSLTEKYEIAFIDGSHEEEIVKEDIKNSNRVLVKGGIMILDDVKHTGVKNAIKWFVKNYSNYRRVTVNVDNFPKLDFDVKTIIYDDSEHKKSFNAPNTMFAFIKIGGLPLA